MASKTSVLAHDIGKILESGGLLDPQNPTVEADYPRAARDASLLARQTHNAGLAKMAGWLTILARLSQYQRHLVEEKDSALALLKTQLVAIGEVVSLGGYDLRNSGARVILAKVMDRLLDEMYYLKPMPGQKPDPSVLRPKRFYTPEPGPPRPDKVAELVEEAVEEIREIESQAPDLPPPAPLPDVEDEEPPAEPTSPPPSPPPARAPSPPPAAPAAPAAPAKLPPAQEGRGQLLEAIRKGKQLKKAEDKKAPPPKAAPTSVAEILAARMVARREAMGVKDEKSDDDDDDNEAWD